MNHEKAKGPKIRSIIKPATSNAAYSIPEFPRDEPGVIYVRQSSIKQVQNNIHSFEMQTDKFIEHFREQLKCTGHIEIVADDEGVSGTKDIHQRAGLSRVMRLIEGKELLHGQRIGWIGAVHVNRLTRDKWLVTPGTIMKECYEHNVWVATLRMNFNFQDEYCRRVFMIEAEESARHLEWMKLVLGGGKMAASSKGYYDGRWIVPGYIVDRSDEKRKKYMAYEPHAQVIRWLFCRFLELNGNFRELCKEVEKMPFLFPAFDSSVDVKSVSKFVGHRSKHGALIKEGVYAGNYKTSASGLQGILCNPVYIGWWLPIGGGVVENNHEPIIEEPLFTYAHKRLSTHTLEGERQKPMRVRHSEGVNGGILKNVIYDDQDKLMYTMKDMHAKSSHRYRSAEADRVIVNYRFSVYSAEYDLAFLEKLFERINVLEHLEKWSDKLQAQQDKKEKAQAETRSLIRKQLDRAVKQRAEVMEILSDPEIPKSKQMKIDYANQINGIERQIEKWERELNSIGGNEEDEEATLFEIKALLPNIKAKWEALSFEVRLRFINALVKKVVLTQVAPSWMKFEIYWKKPIGHIVDIGHVQRSQANRACWSAEEDAIILEHYLNGDGAELIKMLPNRTWESITKRGRRLGLVRTGKRKHSIPITSPAYNNKTIEDQKYEEEQGLQPMVKSVQWFARLSIHALGHASIARG